MVTHYDVLGVRRDATPGEIRRAYLVLARDHHPDRHAGSSPEVRRAAEHRMRSVNEAWHTVGDPGRRSRYDGQLDRAPSDATIDDPPVRAWQPYGGPIFDDEPDDERLDDSHRPAPRGGRVLAMVPAGLFALGFAALMVGIAMGARPLLTIGMIGVVLGGLGFVAAPFLVIMESRRNDEL